jgi:hypothetical protein
LPLPCPPPDSADSTLMSRKKGKVAIDLSTGSYISLVFPHNSSGGVR